MKKHALMMTLLFSLVAGAVTAAETAKPSSMVCALGRVTVCTIEGCKDGSTDALGVPGMIRLDLLTGEMFAVTAADAGRKSTFKVLEQNEDRIVVQGFENGRAFSAVIDSDGVASIATSTDGTSIVMFGRCSDLAQINAGAESATASKKK